RRSCAAGLTFPRCSGCYGEVAQHWSSTSKNVQIAENLPQAVNVAFTFLCLLYVKHATQVAWEAGGLDMTAARRKAHRRDSHVDHVAVVDEAVSTTLTPPPPTHGCEPARRPRPPPAPP